jgi:valyl-tRNA synthetase
MRSAALPTRYDPSDTESRWYNAWEEAGLFAPDSDPDKVPYTITIPPPNITGSLHMGHALCYSIQDALGRFWRLRGKSVLIVPGQDHAGIATQTVVERQLREEGASASALGREKFIERVWQWRRESGDKILEQLRSLGCAFDWSRNRFTLDDAYVQAVLAVFVDWFERGIIYRGKRVVNWDPVLHTSVSDIETDRQTIKGKLYAIRYPFADGSGFITIATTRPETMLADVAVAVHPSDDRYRAHVGKLLTLPLVNREIPLIADTYPDPKFGSGAVKITPAHDPNDYEVGVRHGLPMPVLLDHSAKITAEGGPYAGLDRYEARKRVLADLEQLGLLEKEEDYEIPVLVSQRSGAVVEPLLSEQWFASQSEIAKAAIEAAEQDLVRFYPSRYKRIFLEWMTGLRDWCLSRQLWWGHRIPVYYDEAGNTYAALSWEEAQHKAGANKIIRQDEDVLDTWFSSGLWPFAVQGWPQDRTFLGQHYPTDVLVTARDIIFLWVARMMMMSLDQLHQIPFRDVYIYATVLTDTGKRMSKSLGTGKDPEEIIKEFGADALRFALHMQTGTNQEIRYSDRHAEEARNFCSKVWNAARFTLMHVTQDPDDPGRELQTIDRWILSRLAATEQIVREGFEQYDLAPAMQALHSFFWGELCDWYIEIAKDRLADPQRSSVPQWVLMRTFEAFLAMLHPTMPHLTEELHAHFPFRNRKSFLMASEWPEHVQRYRDPEQEAIAERWFEITRGLRALRAILGHSPLARIPVAHYQGDLDGGHDIVASQAWVESLVPGEYEGRCLSSHIEGVTLQLPIPDDFDAGKEIARLQRERDKVATELAGLNSRLDNPNFVAKADPQVVERERASAQRLVVKLETIDHALCALMD